MLIAESDCGESRVPKANQRLQSLTRNLQVREAGARKADKSPANTDGLLLSQESAALC